MSRSVSPVAVAAQAADEGVLANLWAIACDLPRHGAPMIIAEYDGSEDSGTVEDIYLADDDETALADQSLLTKELSEAVDIAVCEILPGGWEDNEGSVGRVVFNLADRTIRIDHGWREITVNEDIIELEFPGCEPQLPGAVPDADVITGREPCLSETTEKKGGR